MMTEEQKWMNRLKRVLKDIPEGSELMVTHNELALQPKGFFSNYATSDNDMLAYHCYESQCEFYCDDVVCTSENM